MPAGLNNAYLINTRHEFARVYNDNSVLENRHVSLLYTLLANEPHADIFSDLADAKWKDMRKLIINCIIHTDMVHHFPMVSKVRPVEHLARGQDTKFRRICKLIIKLES